MQLQQWQQEHAASNPFFSLLQFFDLCFSFFVFPFLEWRLCFCSWLTAFLSDRRSGKVLGLRTKNINAVRKQIYFLLDTKATKTVLLAIEERLLRCPDEIVFVADVSRRRNKASRFSRAWPRNKGLFSNVLLLAYENIFCFFMTVFRRFNCCF